MKLIVRNKILCVCAHVCQEKAVKNHITLLKVFVIGGKAGGTHRRRKILCPFCNIKSKCWSSIKMATIKNSTNNKCWRGCEQKEALLHCWWECKVVQPLWRIIRRFLRKEKQNYQTIQQSHSWAYIRTKF